MKPLKRTKVFVMLSGGVDSSVAAARVKDFGVEVTAVYMKNWSPDRLKKVMSRKLALSCSSEEDILYARAVAQKLGLRFREANFEDEYWGEVIEPFFKGIDRGETPNPDIWCNRFIKFGVFEKWAKEQGADLIVSGHYARLRRAAPLSGGQGVAGRVNLLRSADPNKDQSYFLAQVSEKKLRCALFPIGHLTKPQVRSEAFSRKLPTSARKDSQGICFVGRVQFKDFLKERFSEKIGDVVLKDGSVVGKHRGVWFYTIGQRFGLSIKRNLARQKKTAGGLLLASSDFEKMPFEWRLEGSKGKFAAETGFSANPPIFYVLKKDIKRNILVVGEDDGQEPLWRKELTADSWNLFLPLHEKELYDVELRYHQKPRAKGNVKLNANFNGVLPLLNPAPDFKIRISLRQAVRAVTPGQIVVLSKGDIIVGSGVIRQ